MIDPDSRERAALQNALKCMATLMAEIGWNTRFTDLDAQQAAKLAETAVDGYLESMGTSAPGTEPEVPF